jgi:hypothetical protein
MHLTVFSDLLQGDDFNITIVTSTLYHPLDREHGDIVRAGRRVHKIGNPLPDSFEELPPGGHRLGEYIFYPDPVEKVNFLATEGFQNRKSAFI